MESRLSTASLMQINEEKLRPHPGRHSRHRQAPRWQNRGEKGPGHRLPKPGQQPLPGHQGAENSRRSIPPPHGHRGIRQRDPLLFVELKKSTVDVQNAYTDNYTDYLDTIPHLFWYNAFLILSNGLEAKVGTLGSKYEFFPRVEAPQRAGGGQRGPGDDAPGDLQKGGLSGSAGKLHPLRPLRRTHRQDPGPQSSVSGCQRGG